VTIRERSVVTMRSSSRPGQGEMAQVVRRHLRLEPVGGLPVGGAHHAGVVQQDVQPGVPAEHLCGGPGATDTRVGQVEVEQLQGGALQLAPPACRGAPARLLRIATGEDHVRSVLGQRAAAVWYPMPLLAPVTSATRPVQVADVRGRPHVAPPVTLAPGDPGSRVPRCRCAEGPECGRRSLQAMATLSLLHLTCVPASSGGRRGEPPGRASVRGLRRPAESDGRPRVGCSLGSG